MFGRPSAKDVLISFLDDEQKQCLGEHGYFFVLGPTGDVYGVTPSKVAVMKDGRVHQHRNVWPIGLDGEQLGTFDSLLHLSLALRTNPDWLLRHGCGDPPGPEIRGGCPPMVGTKLRDA